MKSSKPIDSGRSPNQLIRWKFRRNKVAMGALAVIVLEILVAIFAYWLIPDDSHLASRQVTGASLYPPMSKTMIFEPPVQHQDQNFLDFTFGGRDNFASWIPFDSVVMNSDSLRLLHQHPVSGFQQEQQYVVSDPKALLNEHSFPQRFWLGTDRFGRDVLSRLVLATRISLSVGLVSVVVSLILGLLIGSLAGFYGGWIDQLVLWLVNVFWSIPTFLLAMGLGMLVKVGTDKTLLIFIAIGLTMWVEIARVVRGQILSLREQEFVQAANALGYSDFRSITVHVLPNVIAPIIVLSAANFANAILIESGLSFLGLGVPIQTPSWGAMLSEYKDMIDTPMAYLALFPGLAIMLTVLAFNIMGNGLRDAMDVKSN